MFSIVDCNNFWSPSGGGVRRYHLEKMEFYKKCADVRYSFVMHDNRTFTEQIGENAFIEHLKVPKVMGNWEYRYLTSSAPLKPVLKRINPEVIEVGSPYFMPGIVHKIVSSNLPATKVFGYWHADFPVTYARRFLEPFSTKAGALGEKMAWKHARKHYNRMAGVFVGSELVMKRMNANGILNTHYLPLGVNSEVFHPRKKNEELILALKKGNTERLFLFFPHRFSKEKGLDILLKAYPLLCRSLAYEPVLVIAGKGPYEGLARSASEQYEFVHLKGFIGDRETMAAYYGSADLGFALSKWETFGLSLLESLSSGLPMIAANDGAAYEHIQKSGAGLVLNERTPDGLAKAIVDFSNIKGKEEMKSKARRYAEQFSWEACFEKQLAAYKGHV